jgi:hypothetical protein
MPRCRRQRFGAGRRAWDQKYRGKPHPYSRAQLYNQWGTLNAEFVSHPTIVSPSIAADRNAEITAPFGLQRSLGLSFLLTLTGIQRLPRISIRELMRRRDESLRLEPPLEATFGFLDDQRDVIERIRRDLVRGLKQPGSGCHGLTATQVLRALVLMRFKNWDYRELRERIVDGLTLRQFTDFYCAPAPKHYAFQRCFVRPTPQTLKAVNDLVVQAAVELGLEDSAKPRAGTTVVQTDIHHPTDNTFLWDVVRVVTRLGGGATAHGRRGGGCMRSSA